MLTDSNRPPTALATACLTASGPPPRSLPFYCVPVWPYTWRPPVGAVGA